MKKVFKALISCVLLAAFALSALAGCAAKDDGKITVTFDANCTEIVFEQTKKVTPGEAYGELPVIEETRTGYTFGGWSAKKDGSGKAVTAETIVDEAKGDHTLYAKWNGNQYDLSFDLQGGKIGEKTAVEATKVTYGSMYGALAIPDNPQKDGYKFVGWYLNAEGTGDKIAVSSKVTTAAAHTLYAKWKLQYTNYTFDEPDMIEDFDKRNETNFTYEIVNVDGDNKLKVQLTEFTRDEAWLVLWYNLKAGQTVSFDVTVDYNSEVEAKYGFHTYGATAAGDPKTSGALGEAGNVGWYWGQGVFSNEDKELWNNGKVTFTMNIKEDCFGVAINPMFGRTGELNNPADVELWKNTVFYIDNVVIHAAE